MARLRSTRPRRHGRVTFLQFVSSVAGFLLFSVMGGVLVAGLALPAVTVAGEAANGASEVFEALPQEFEQTTLPEASSIYASDGTTLLATFYSQNRQVVPLEEISPWMQFAQVSIEDRRFWEHNGVDGEGLARVGFLFLTSDATQGASTLTQQLIKNMLLAAAETKQDDIEKQAAIEAATETSVTRKVREWRLALAYEERLNNEFGTDCKPDPKVDCGKEQVLESYLNIAQYGTRVYGVEAAAQLYFGVSAKELNVLQAATIAGITQNPTKWDPLRYPDNAEFRRNLVLQAMYEVGKENPDQGLQISDEQLQVYLHIPIEATLSINYPKFSCAASQLAPLFCDYVTKVITNDAAFNGEGEQLLYGGGLKIVTTLDARMQGIANDTLRASIPPDDSSGLENALVALDVTTGNILAMSQNRDFDPTSKAPNTTAINYSTDYAFGGSLGFSPGSSFKPVILAEWLDSGRSLTQVVSGAEREWELSEFQASCPEGGGYVGKWKPGNVEASENRQTSVLDATAYSINTAYVAMAQQLDLCLVRDMAAELGFHRADGAPFEVVPSMTLGSQNASPLTMASVYQTFANRGVHCDPRSILSISKLDGTAATYADGSEIEVPAVSCAQTIDPEVADGVTYALESVLSYGTARKSQLDRPAAGKTGTAQRNTHLWFVGYTPQIVTAVWTGNADVDTPIKSMRVNGTFKRTWYGGDLSAPVWRNFMNAALSTYEVVALPGPSDRVLNGVKKPVPDVIGKTEEEAQFDINQAGFFGEAAPDLIYSPDLIPGTVAKQSPEPGSTLGTGQTMTYWLATDQLPYWWYNWPSGWDPLTPPADFWGSTWPPASWTPNNPSVGWDPTPDPDPTPTPTPGP